MVRAYLPAQNSNAFNFSKAFFEVEVHTCGSSLTTRIRAPSWSRIRAPSWLNGTVTLSSLTMKQKHEQMEQYCLLDWLRYNTQCQESSEGSDPVIVFMWHHLSKFMLVLCYRICHCDLELILKTHTALWWSGYRTLSNRFHNIKTPEILLFLLMSHKLFLQQVSEWHYVQHIF